MFIAQLFECHKNPKNRTVQWSVLLFLITFNAYADDLPTQAIHYGAGVTLWPYEATDTALSHQFGSNFWCSAKAYCYRLPGARPYAYTATGQEMFENKGQCLIYGPYRKHNSAFDVLAEIEVVVTTQRKESMSSDSFKSLVVFTIDLYQPGYETVIKKIRIEDLSFSDNAISVTDKDTKWNAITFSAKNVPPDISTGYEVRLCIPDDFNVGIVPLLSGVYVKKYHIKEITEEKK